MSLIPTAIRSRSVPTMLVALSALTLLSSASSLSAQAAAGSNTPDYAAAMHRAHQREVPTASGAALTPPRLPVAGEMVTYTTIDGKAVRGYLTKPANARRGPAIVMVHEWWGINDNIKAMADRYAGEGYTVLAVDLFGGQVATTPDAAMKLYQAGMSNVAAGEKNVAAAVSYLRTQGATSVGAVGYCFGGHWALRTGLAAGNQVNAVVMYYGAPITAASEIARLTAPVLGLFGGKDTGIPLDSVRAMEAQIRKAGKPVTIEVFANADHAFANPTGQAYDAKVAAEAWSKSLAFFKAHLK